MSRSRSALLVAPAAALTLLVSLIVPQAANASGWPAHPTGIHVSAVTSTSFTVAMNRAAYTKTYRVYASTTKSDLYYANLTHGKHTSALRSGSASSPRVTVRGLTFSTRPYYWRVETLAGSKRSYGAGIYERGLLPSVPTSLTATTGTGGTSLTWNSGAATGYVVQRAADAAMTKYVATFTIRGSNHQYTPYGMLNGYHYYFRIRAVNVNTDSGWTRPISVTHRAKSQAVKVMTYNILQLTSDGSHEPGGTIASWSSRRTAAAALIKSANPNVFAVQEGWPYVGSSHTRQVDSLASALSSVGEHYTVAATEITYPNKGYSRVGNYILYKSSEYAPYGPHGHASIGYGSSDFAYQGLQNRTTGAKFLFVCVHLVATSSSRTWDVKREDATSSLISQVSSIASQYHLPVIYGGDFNTNTLTNQHPLDGPTIVMRSHRIADARLVAQSRANEQYDSMNQYVRAPWKYSIYIDYLYTSPGVSVSSWGMAMRLSNGRFVGTIPSDHNPVWAWAYIPY